ncbi:Hypothetical protein PENO1_047070 [Penicillium occitanis (nom. inval.)]|nr:Hypothetical protein PENO1_047070 [Penicillium occitanis (nom. inval.)]PCH01500.1 hypothetical protein PENOC_048100 [Penicillium occitanis (nom. inval.)]
MGRKPNQLILEYFTRGPKLEDASNRYQHTCKACGEKFPKGRIDSLTTHLVKKCQALSMSARQSIVMRIHDLPALDDSDPNKAAMLAKIQKAGKASDLPYSTRPAFDGLNVLAEASRRVGASDQTKRRGAAALRFSQPMTVGGKTIMIDPALEAEAFHPPPTDNNEDLILAGVAAAAASLSANEERGPSASPSLQNNDTLQPDTNAEERQSSSQLSLIAASASEMASQSLAMGSELTDEPHVGPAWTDHQLSSTDQFLLDSLQGHDPTLAATQRAASYPRPIAMNPNTTPTKGFVNDFGSSPKPQKPKVRSRFSADRRKEVQEVRKRGACIRCRMLKKPCSGDSPCQTCASVESARLWKQPCIRTRLVEECELYGAGLHTTLAFHDVNSMQAQTKYESYVGRVEAAHFDDGPFYVTFSALIGQKAGMSPIDPQLQALVEDGQFQGSTQDMYMLDGETDDLPGKCENYIKRLQSTFIENETSPIIKSTLTLAAHLADEKKDTLLDRVVELWLVTHVLVDSELQWKLFVHPLLPPTAVDTLAMPTEEGRVPIDRNANADSYNLICSQLRAAVEKRASLLSKNVMNELERRLLQRHHSGCWENEDFVGRWPLDKRPQYYANQGDRFSEILHMLLRMRGLPPKTTINAETGLLKAVENSDPNAILWFDTIHISPLYLEQRQLAQFDPTDSRSLDLKFASKILLPPPTA